MRTPPTIQDFPPRSIEGMLARLVEEMRMAREQAAELHADHWRRVEEADEKRARSADEDTDKRIAAARADLKEYTVRIGEILQEQDNAQREMQKEIDQLRAYLDAHRIGGRSS